MRTVVILVLLVSSWSPVTAAEPTSAASSTRGKQMLRHSPEWVRARLRSMMAVDDAYLWHDVLGGRAIHQNSYTNPPNEPLEGNFHTQQQGLFALMKLHAYDVFGRKDGKLLDDARTLLDWVLDNGYDAESRTFHFCYNTRSKTWKKLFYPEFNIITVAALLRYDAIRPTRRYVEVADAVFDTIVRVGWDAERGGFMSGFARDPKTGEWTGKGEKGIYGAGYLSLMMLDAYESTGQKRFCEWARKAVDPCNRHLWDAKHGGWLAGTNRAWATPKPSTKFTHIIADMIQANYRLHLAGQGKDYLSYAERGLAFLVRHNRAPNGLWYRHNAYDGSDPKRPPDVAGDGGPGTCYPYDRQMQAIVACCLGYQATGRREYLEYVDATLDGMERTHKMVYPAGVNYGYMGVDGANTWCHLWGLKAFMAIAKLQAETCAR